MSRTCAFTVIGLAAVLVVTMALTGSFAPAPLMALAPLLVLVAVLVAVEVLGPARRAMTDRNKDRRAMDALRDDPLLAAAGKQLLGEYPPYVMDAARDLGESHRRSAVPVLVRALEVQMERKPAGWREMTGAMAEALAQIGDPACLPTLRRLRATTGAEEIERLPAIIASLEDPSRLLRPAKEGPETLLRSSQCASDAADPDKLLRPTESE